jgi:hypothetical protein
MAHLQVIIDKRVGAQLAGPLETRHPARFAARRAGNGQFGWL